GAEGFGVVGAGREVGDRRVEQDPGAGAGRSGAVILHPAMHAGDDVAGRDVGLAGGREFTDRSGSQRVDGERGPASVGTASISPSGAKVMRHSSSLRLVKGLGGAPAWAMLFATEGGPAMRAAYWIRERHVAPQPDGEAVAGLALEL